MRRKIQPQYSFKCHINKIKLISVLILTKNRKRHVPNSKGKYMYTVLKPNEKTHTNRGKSVKRINKYFGVAIDKRLSIADIR